MVKDELLIMGALVEDEIPLDTNPCPRCGAEDSCSVVEDTMFSPSVYYLKCSCGFEGPRVRAHLHRTDINNPESKGGVEQAVLLWNKLNPYMVALVEGIDISEVPENAIASFEKSLSQTDKINE